MKMLLVRILIFLISMGTSVSYAQMDENKGSSGLLKNRINSYLSVGASNGCPGSVLVVKEGEIILNKGYGLANREERIVISPSTVFDIGSVTKQFTATAILKLVAWNKVKLTDNLGAFFKEVPEDKQAITIHQLLTHSAGLTDFIGAGDFDHIPTSVFFKELLDTKLLHKPGSKYKYSNSGYSILARIIEIVSGKEYEDFLDMYLFQPSGMTQTGYLKPNWDKNKYAIGYQLNLFPIGAMAARYKKEGKISWVLKGNGGLNSTQEDMYKWYLALTTNNILPKELTKLLTTPHILEYEDDTSYYAYGWAIFKTDRNTKKISHNGSNGIFFHDFIWLPEEDTVILFFTNGYTGNLMNTAWEIERMVFDSSYTPEAIKEDLSTSVMKYAQNYNGQLEALPQAIEQEFKGEIKAPYLLNNLGYYLLSEKRKKMALAFFKLNTSLFPKESNIWDSLGECYLKLRNTKKGVAAYKKALLLDSDYPNAAMAERIVKNNGSF